MVNCYWFLIGTTTLNYALKEKKRKEKEKEKKNPNQKKKKIVHEIVNFCSPNLTKPQKKV